MMKIPLDPAFKEDVGRRTDAIANSVGPDVGEALCRYEEAGGNTDAYEGAVWVSVAFALGRLARFSVWGGRNA